MARSHTLLALLAFAPALVLACSTAPDGGGHTGGASSSGGTLGSGGTSSTSDGDTATGGSTTGGTSSGGASSGGRSSDGDGGFGGETATGGAEASGGDAGVGGSGGTQAVGYEQCDGDLGMEDNPDCADGELCVENACTELCPMNDSEAAEDYECPAGPPGGEATSRCQTFVGRCILHCAFIGSAPELACPDGMVCSGEACGWPD